MNFNIPLETNLLKLTDSCDTEYAPAIQKHEQQLPPFDELEIGISKSRKTGFIFKLANARSAKSKSMKQKKCDKNLRPISMDISKYCQVRIK